MANQKVEEIKVLLDTAYHRAQIILQENRHKLDAVAMELLKKEVITAEQFQEIIQRV